MTPTDLTDLRAIVVRAADPTTYGAESIRRDLAYRAALTPTVALDLIDTLIRVQAACRCEAGIVPGE